MIRAILTMILLVVLVSVATLTALFGFAEGAKLLRHSETYGFRTVRDNPPDWNVRITLPEHTAHFEKARSYRVVHRSDDGDVITDYTVYPISDAEGVVLLLRTERFGYDVEKPPVGLQKKVTVRIAKEYEREEMARELKNADSENLPVVVEQMQGYWFIFFLECGVSLLCLIMGVWALI